MVIASSDTPTATLFLTVPGCVNGVPMGVIGRGVFLFYTRACSNLDGVIVTVNSDHGGAATAVIK